MYENGALLNAVDKNGYTAVRHLSENGMVEELEVMLSWNPDVNKISRSKGYSPLHISVMKKNLTITRMLILAGADVNQKNKVGEPPIHMATRAGHIQLLILAGAEVDSLAKLRINSCRQLQSWFSVYEERRCGLVNRLQEIARGVIRQELKHTLPKVSQTGLPKTLQEFVLMKGELQSQSQINRKRYNLKLTR